MLEKDAKKKEEYAKKFMEEQGLKGKAKRIEIMRIIDLVGYDKRKIKVALRRASISERI
ncbi:MAG: hypothetical protein ACTSRH_03895 [Promethearchaeota archaeon]